MDPTYCYESLNVFEEESLKFPPQTTQFVRGRFRCPFSKGGLTFGNQLPNEHLTKH